ASWLVGNRRCRVVANDGCVVSRKRFAHYLSLPSVRHVRSGDRLARLGIENDAVDSLAEQNARRAITTAKRQHQKHEREPSSHSASPFVATSLRSAKCRRLRVSDRS